MKKILHKIYQAIPFKREIYLVLRKFIKLPHRWYQHFYFKGVFPTKINSSSFLMMNYGYQFHVENEYFWGGIHNGWEKVSTDLWIQLCEDADVVFDIGANTGCFSLIAKTLRPDAKIYAFEPMEGILKKLRYNMELNHYDVHVEPKALSNYDGKATIYPTSLDHVYSVTVNTNMFADQQVHKVTIPTCRLDHFIEQHQIKKIDLMKIDVETHEPEVLEGMGKYLKEMRPNMLIEIQTSEIGEKIEKLIEGIGYVFYNIHEEKGVRKVTSLTKSDWLNYLICHPEFAAKHQL